MNEVQNQSGNKMVCNCPHHKMMPALIIVFGLVFLLVALGIFSPRTVDIIWPILVIAGGIFKLNSSKCKCC